jgi:DnaJ-class molecular chaperone
MNNENFYDVLGVSETATQDEIKKTYRKLAKENHPDIGGNEDLFKKISSAYDVLGDEQKRQQYDQQRKNPFGGGGFNFNEMFNDLFGQKQRPQNRQAHVTNITVNIGVLDSYLAKKHNLTYKRQPITQQVKLTRVKAKSVECARIVSTINHNLNWTRYQVTKVAAKPVTKT